MHHHVASTGTRLAEGLGGGALAIVGAVVFVIVMRSIKAQYGSYTVPMNQFQSLRWGIPGAAVFAGVILIIEAISGH